MKVLVLGYGLLGQELCRQTKWDYLSRSNGFDLTEIGTGEAYSEQYNKWKYILGQYDVIVNCMANTDTYSNNKDDHWDINYKSVIHLVNLCNALKKRLVYISTDYVYAGSDMNANESETVPVHAKNWYSYTKLIADGYVQAMANNYLLIRCSHKPFPFPYDKAWIDQFGNFDYVHEIASIIAQLIEYQSKGVYNVGTEYKSIYELAKESNPDVTPIPRPFEAPMDVSMDLTKLKEFKKSLKVAIFKWQ